MNNNNHYIIEGGAEGKKRLNVLANVLSPYTKALIESDGPIEGKRFLDVGCGGGHLSLMVAKMVGDGGHVTGVDFDGDIIRLAQDDAVDAGINNVTFRTLNAYDIDYEDEFDIVYSRFLLSHLTEPMRLLKKMKEALKPGGRLIVEDIDFSGHFCFPASKDFELYQDYFVKAAKHNGQNAHIGLSLFSLLEELGLRDVQYDVVQPSHHTGEGKWMAYNTMDRIKDTVIKQELASEGAVSAILANLKTFTEREDTIISLPRIFWAWGYK
jgi:2-polyprenyl-3-methyl-5-hydroxy-6-metoxy-1,4-benzoquinol methylase